MMTNKKAEQIIRRFRVKAEKLATLKSQKDYEYFIRLYSSEFMNKAGESEVDDRNRMKLFLRAACRDAIYAGGMERSGIRFARLMVNFYMEFRSVWNYHTDKNRWWE